MICQKGYCHGHKLNLKLAPFDGRDHTGNAMFNRRLAAVREAVDLSSHCQPAKDQGSLGACGGEASSAAYHVLAHKAEIKRDFSPMFAYFVARDQAGNVREDSGVDNRDLLKGLQKDGCASEALYPFNPSTFFLRPSKQAYADAAKWQLLRYARLADVDEAMGVLDLEECPVLVAIPVYGSFESDTVAHTGIVPNPDTENEKLLGWHDVLCIGYDKKTGLLKCLNSWGPDWGDHGCFYLKLDYPIKEFWAFQLTELGVDLVDSKASFWSRFKKVVGGIFSVALIAFSCGCGTTYAMKSRLNGDNWMLAPATMADSFAMAVLWDDGRGDFPREPTWARFGLTPVLLIDYIPSLATDALLLPLDLITVKL